MIYEFLLPDIGEGVVEGEIVKWLVKEGDLLAEDQPIAEIMTDKATVVIPSPKTGRVVKLHGAEGTMAKVHQPLVTIELAGAPAAVRDERPVGVGGKKVSVLAAPEAKGGAGAVAAPRGEPAGGAGARVLATPVTRRIAREHGVDLAAVVGSGPMGRVMKADVLRLVLGEPAPAAAPQPATAAPSPAPLAGDERIPLRGLRKRIAEKMSRSRRSAAHFTFVEEVNMTALAALRARMNEALGKDGARLTFLPFFIKAIVAAFKNHPIMNAVMDEEKQELVIRRAHNIGIAVATDAGLVVPVIKDADKKSLRALALEIDRLAKAARENRLKLDEISGGTFTITSLGALGGIFATPIINHPEVAILGIHRIEKRPVAVADKIEIQDRMYMSLSFDHRVIDGHQGAAFAYEVIKYLQSPELLFLEL